MSLKINILNFYSELCANFQTVIINSSTIRTQNVLFNLPNYENKLLFNKENLNIVLLNLESFENYHFDLYSLFLQQKSAGLILTEKLQLKIIYIHTVPIPIRTIVISVCLVGCSIITQEPLDRFASNLETRETYGNVLSLVLRF